MHVKVVMKFLVTQKTLDPRNHIPPVSCPAYNRYSKIVGIHFFFIKMKIIIFVGFFLITHLSLLTINFFLVRTMKSGGCAILFYSSGGKSLAEPG